MKNIKLQIVNFDQAKKLKKTGFNWYVRDFYAHLVKSQIPKLEHGCNTYNHNNDSSNNIFFSAPPIALALKWFRDEKGIMNSVTLSTWISTKTWQTRSVYHAHIKGERLNLSYEDYEKAESELLNKLLTLIDK